MKKTNSILDGVVITTLMVVMPGSDGGFLLLMEVLTSHGSYSLEVNFGESLTIWSPLGSPWVLGKTKLRAESSSRCSEHCLQYVCDRKGTDESLLSLKWSPAGCVIPFAIKNPASCVMAVCHTQPLKGRRAWTLWCPPSSCFCFGVFIVLPSTFTQHVHWNGEAEMGQNQKDKYIERLWCKVAWDDCRRTA